MREKILGLKIDGQRWYFVTKSELESEHLAEELKTTALQCSSPGKLFEGLEHCRAVVFNSSARCSDSSSLFVTKYHRWPSIFRPRIFSLIAYVEGEEHVRPGLFPKH